MIVLFTALLVAGCGTGDDAPSQPSQPLAGPPVTAAALRRSLERSGLEIRWHDGRAGGTVIADLAGEARDRHGGRVAFELAITRGRANISALGRSRYPLRYDPASGSPMPLHEFTKRELTPVPRGVVRNLAYANWFYAASDSRASDRVSARLDAAIIETFPRDDPEAHPILKTPR